MILGIDFDRVLFDTQSFDRYLRQKIDEMEHVENPAPLDENGNYDPEIHGEILGFDPQKIFDRLENLERFVYDDVEALEELPEGIETVVVTRGSVKFQSKKVENSGILEYLDDYVVIEKGPKDVVGIDFLVDDREEELERIDVPGMLFKRSEHSMDDVVEKVRQKVEA